MGVVEDSEPLILGIAFADSKKSITRAAHLGLMIASDVRNKNQNHPNAMHSMSQYVRQKLNDIEEGTQNPQMEQKV